MSELDKLACDAEFLTDVKQAALQHRDVAIPYGHPDLYQTKMFVLGVIMVLKGLGYNIEKEE